ncbi:MAG: hypothetical protein WBD59_02400, partial [Candidatus Sulfotelmatobacter sp.]
MNRRTFLSKSLRAAVAGSVVAKGSAALAKQAGSTGPARQASHHSALAVRHDLNRHRFGVNYTPSKNWWFCWNEWDANAIERDLDAIASLGADHLRILLIWPYFQPNPTWVSSLHLERFDQL